MQSLLVRLSDGRGECCRISMRTDEKFSILHIGLIGIDFSLLRTAQPRALTFTPTFALCIVQPHALLPLYFYVYIIQLLVQILARLQSTW